MITTINTQPETHTMSMETDPTTVARPAGFWIRVAAAIIDTIVVLIITLPILFGIYGSEYFTSPDLEKGPADFLISYVFPAAATIALWVLVGATPGKLVCGLRVVDVETGDRLALWQAIVRYLGYFISMIPLFLGIFWVGWDKRKQGFHDKLARSLVVHKAK